MTLAEFTRLLQTLGLLTADQLAQLEAEESPQDLGPFAQLLIKKQLLTKYQARKILDGEAKSLLLGNYLILDKIGQGGMGMVLKARHRRMNRMVALKVLSPDIVKTKDLVARFQREVQAAARLEHPHIVTAFDADEADGTFFLVLQFVSGQDLATYVKKNGPLSVENAVQCILQAGRGLEYAHSQGIIHRDIKPSNLLLDDHGHVKILDMGLARIEGGDAANQAELTATGAVMGTVDYMAPEQAMSTRHADARSDMYSLGITLWYLLTGRPAYEGETLMARLVAHRESPLPSLRKVRPDIPEALERVFHTLIAKRPEQRFANMAGAIRALETYPQGAVLPASRGVAAAAADSRLDLFLSQMTNDVSPTFQEPLSADAEARSNDATLVSGQPLDGTDPQTLTSAMGSSIARRFTKDQEGKGNGIWIAVGIAGVIMLAIVFSPGFFSRVIDPDSAASKNASKELSEALAQIAAESSPMNDPVWPAGKEDREWYGVLPNPAPLPGVKQWQVESAAPRGKIYAVKYSPDSNRFVVYSTDKHLRVFRWVDNQLELEQIIPTRDRGIRIQLFWSPDSRWLAWCTEKSDRVRTWDTESQQYGPELPSETNAGFAGWNPEGTLLACGGSDVGGQGVLLYEWPSGKLRHSSVGYQHPPYRLHWSSDAQWLAGHISSSGVLVWKADGNRGPRLNFPSGYITRDFVWHPQRPLLAVVYTLDKQGHVQVFDMQDPEHPQTIGPPVERSDWATHLYWTPDGTGLVRPSANNTRQLIYPLSGEPDFNLPSIPAAYQHCQMPAFRPKSSQAVFMGSGEYGIIWDLSRSREDLRIGTSRILAGDWSPDGKWLAVADSQGNLQVWDGQLQQPQATLPGRADLVSVLDWHPKQPQLLALQIKSELSPSPLSVAILDDQGARQSHTEWNYPGITFRGRWKGESSQIYLNAGEMQCLYDSQKPTDPPAEVKHWKDLDLYKTALAPDGDQVLIHARKKGEPKVGLWLARFSKPELIKIPLENPFQINHFAWKPDSSQFLVSWILDLKHRPHKSQLWMSNPPRQLASADRDFNLPAFSPDGQTIVTWGHSDSSMFRSNTLEFERYFDGRQTQPRWALSWRPDSQELVTNTERRQLEIWDQKGVLSEHELPLDDASAVAWHPNGKQIAAGSAQGLIRSWERFGEEWYPTWTQLTLSGDDWVTFGPGGRLLKSSSKALPQLRILLESESGKFKLQSAVEFYAAHSDKPGTAPAGPAGGTSR